MREGLWIFGYGSLVWRPDFPHAERRAGWIAGWSRRFWQGSTDHRGVPEAPGRVATLVSDPDGECWGMAYRVDERERAAVLARLDHRESGGFERVEVSVRMSEVGVVDALTYVAAPGNPNYLGPAPLPEIAAQVRRSRGPSGHNVEYVLRLSDWLRALGADDSHVFSLAALVGEGETGAEAGS